MTDTFTTVNAPNDWTVVVSETGRFGIWPATLPIPEGWQRNGSATGERDRCLKWIGEHWVDSRLAGVGRQL